MTWSLRQLLELLAFPVAIALGQIFFKRAATQVGSGSGGEWLLALARVPTMWWAIFLYAASTLLWVRILTTMPLSRAYPFVALAFVLVPAAGYAFFKEPVSHGQMLGIALIIAGVVVAARA
jgi:undecaprenyl phosphate-alpha-L-ara4N flippase subunit ArnE